MMLDESDALINSALDAVLKDWHQWQLAFQGSMGWYKQSVHYGCWQVSNQYATENGSRDAEIHDSRMETTDFEISEMQEPYKSAIYCNARNLYVERAVFRSPRLPADDIERARLMVEARGILTGRLMNAGIL